MKKFISSLLICAGVSSIALPNFCCATGEDKGTIVINQYFGDGQKTKKDKNETKNVVVNSNNLKDNENQTKNNQDTSIEKIMHFAKYTLKNDKKSEEKVAELIKSLEEYKKEIKAEKDKAWRAEFNKRLHDARSKFFEKVIDIILSIGLATGAISLLCTFIWNVYAFGASTLAMFDDVVIY